ncbi:MAG: type II toxin-antitoxin system RelE/ParE family toxin [Saccharospirillum sp.]|nr:type II toxin-antitoxin system RelE/ParE family toxin [Saccharospirillum sp.]
MSQAGTRNRWIYRRLKRLAVSGSRRLIDHPSLGANYDHVFSGYRRLQVERHSVFYQLHESEVLVVRVLHEDVDAPERLLE